jgi:uncharacterized protein (TIGR00266 family)
VLIILWRCKKLEYNIEYKPSFSLLKVKLNAGEKITAEGGAMVYMSPGIEIETHTRGGGGIGGLFKSVKTSVLGGESFFINTFTATEDSEIALTGVQLGDVDSIELNDDEMILQSGAYIASTEGIEIDTSWQGMKGLLGEGDIVMLKASGNGKVWISSFGAIEKKELAAGEKLILDTGHAVAFNGSITYSVKKVGGLKSTILSGEGLVFEIIGPGSVYIQTRILSGFARSLIRYLPTRRGN